MALALAECFFIYIYLLFFISVLEPWSHIFSELLMFADAETHMPFRAPGWQQHPAAEELDPLQSTVVLAGMGSGPHVSDRQLASDNLVPLWRH
jgi:hypothetical protein